jgi:hypothetical protein
MAITATLSCGSAQAYDVALSERFAECTGRLSAEIEHAWLIGDDRADELQVQRDEMANLLDAVSEPDARVRSMAHRIAAKAAHADLIASAYFSEDQEQASRAAARAETLVLTCTAMLLS